MDVVTSERLDLVLITEPQLRAILEGRSDEIGTQLGVKLPAGWMQDRVLPRWRLEQIEAEPGSAPWLLRALILREPRTYVGYFNFHGPPGPDGWVEMGYDIEPDRRRQGFATEAALRMMRWAAERHGVVRFRASISPENEASLKMIEKLGFHQTGTQMDEIDGLELVFERSGVPRT